MTPKPKDEAAKAILVRQMEEGLAERVFPVAVSICRRDRKPNELSSGTLYLEFNRLFVITCAHSIPAHPSGKLWILRPSLSRQSDGFPHIVAVHRYPGDWPDIALLELDPQVLDTYLKDFRPLTPSDLGSLDYANPSHEIATLVGNPTEHAVYRKRGNTELIGANVSCLWHHVVRPEDWPSPLSQEHLNEPAVDMYLRAPTEDYNDYNDGGARFRYRKPYGFSGGGVWAMHPTGGLWSPSQFKLVGVQAEWNHIAGFLRAVRIEQIPRLV